MKPTSNSQPTLTSWLHLPIRSELAFFIVLLVFVMGLGVLRFAPSRETPSRDSAPPLAAPPRTFTPGLQALAAPSMNIEGDAVPLNLAYYVGVYVESIDPALAAQLKIESGLVVRFVVPDSPAEKAGLKPNDLMLRGAGVALPYACSLGEVVNKEPERELDFDLLREGAALAVKMTPVKRPSEMWMPPELQAAATNPALTGSPGQWIYNARPGAPPAAPATREPGDGNPSTEKIAALEKELEKARQEIKSLREKMEGKKTSPANDQ